MDLQLQVFFLFHYPPLPPLHILCSFLEALILVCSFQQHGAIRTTLSGPEDYDNDDAAGFQRIEAREIDTIGTNSLFRP